MNSEQVTEQVTEQAEATEFHIDSEAAANWYLCKLADIEGQKRRVAAQAGIILSQLEGDANHLRNLYEGELQAFVRAELARGGNRRKSKHFLQGTASFRTVPARLTVADEAAARLHAIAEGMEACFVEEFRAAQFRAIAEERLKETGEILPGMEIAPERESFSVKFGKGDGE